MTRHTVVWVQSAQDDLADLWLTSTDRNSVTVAAHGIDQELSQDGATKGTALSEGLRALFVPPLRVLFAVRDDDRIVEVLRVRRI